MQSRTIVITGASDGIGAQAARTLVEHGHNVVVVGRSPDKTKAVATELGVVHHVSDFSSLSDVRSLARTLLATCPRIDVLANNAGGVFGSDRAVTVDGHEKTFQVNYLAPFLLTELLMDRLIESGATVANTSSSAHARFGSLDLDNLELERDYSPSKAYGDAKLAQVLHAQELDRRHGADGLKAVSWHPGNIATNFSSEESTPFRFVYQTPLKHVFLRSPKKGADTLVWLSETTAGADWNPGDYYVKRKPAKISKQAADSALAKELYDRSLAMLSHR